MHARSNSPELERYRDGLYVIERDNQIGDRAAIKRLYRIELAELKLAPLGEFLPVVSRALVRDLISDLKSLNGHVQGEVGIARAACGRLLCADMFFVGNIRTFCCQCG